MKHIPHKTIERLSQYRRALLLCLAKGKDHIFSHEIAKIQHITAVQVRRDLMLIGYTGTLRKGYKIQELINLISEIIDSKEGQKVAIVGIGNIGMSILKYFKGKRPKLAIVAAFDNDHTKIGKKFSEVTCFDINELYDEIKKQNITIAIITVPAERTVEIADLLVKAGIKGILNFTPRPINVPDNVFLEEFDMTTSLEKVAFYVKDQKDNSNNLSKV